MQTIRDLLDALALLPPNWDGSNGLPPSMRAVDSVRWRCERWHRSGLKLPHLVPLPDGSVQMEWHPQGANLEVEIAPDGEIGPCYYAVGEAEEEWDEVAVHTLDALVRSVSAPEYALAARYWEWQALGRAEVALGPDDDSDPAGLNAFSEASDAAAIRFEDDAEKGVGTDRNSAMAAARERMQAEGRWPGGTP